MTSSEKCTIEKLISESFIHAFQSLYNHSLAFSDISLQQTRKEIEGDFTINVFPLIRFSKMSPEQTAHQLGTYLQNNLAEIDRFEVIKGFLNLIVANKYWLWQAQLAFSDPQFGFVEAAMDAPAVLIEYSSPNTNKPLHLGHIRNNLLGFSIAEILKASGQHVKKVNLVNDRGIHICKSMLAWQRYGNGETPESTGIKGDHLVGKYYVQFDKVYKSEMQQLIESGMEEEEAKKQAPIMQAAQQMLRDWEAKEDKIFALWQMMNSWVYKGFEVTYNRLGVDFDQIYYESETYLLGKSIVEKGFESGVLFRKEDGSIWADLTPDGLDQKLLLRADGTSVYMTQDIGTALLRQADFEPQAMLYVVGNEQNYHFDVLKLILTKLGYPWAQNIQHISYGMVELPQGKMKSREGTVVDADDLMQEIVENAGLITTQLGKIEGLSTEEAQKLFNQIGLGALKFFILKVDPKKKMLFNPEESIDFNGNTGPFVQYTFARIQSVLRKAEGQTFTAWNNSLLLTEKERNLIKLLHDYPATIQSAAANYSPAMIANYAYELAKEYNQFYHEIPILKEEDKSLLSFRLALSDLTAKVIKSSMALLGIEVPNRM
jgi:arginyl-tRNA synthetase